MSRRIIGCEKGGSLLMIINSVIVQLQIWIRENILLDSEIKLRQINVTPVSPHK